VRGWDFETAPKQPGDGRVEFTKAMPPDGIAYALYKTEREHGDIVNDTTQVAVILANLCKPD